VWTWDGWGWGTVDIAFPFGRDVLNRHSRVEMSVCELGGQPLDYPFIGAATTAVLNVAPTDDGVMNVPFEVQCRTDGVQRTCTYTGSAGACWPEPPNITTFGPGGPG
jgi:hypothetical protein